MPSCAFRGCDTARALLVGSLDLCPKVGSREGVSLKEEASVGCHLCERWRLAENFGQEVPKRLVVGGTRRVGRAERKAVHRVKARRRELCEAFGGDSDGRGPRGEYRRGVEGRSHHV